MHIKFTLEVHPNQVRLMGFKLVLATAALFEPQQLGRVYTQHTLIWLDFGIL